jgi:predicted dehydrogenase
MRAIMIGAGRMGLTHLALFNLLTDFRICWTVIEPSLIMRVGLRRAFSASMVEDCAAKFRDGLGDFDFAVVANPTPYHAASYSAIRSSSRKVFIEKPLCVAEPSDTVFCGYVLLHHPLQARMRRRAEEKKVSAVNVSLNANTVLSANTNWRGHLATGGGVISEFGSHLFSLIVDIAGPLSQISVTKADIIHSVDAPDRAELEGKSESGVTFKASLDWSNSDARKPVYVVEVSFADGSFARHDFYEFSDSAGHMSVADLNTASGAYLRGIEFTAQARHFLDNASFSQNIALAVEVDRVLEVVRDRSR